MNTVLLGTAAAIVIASGIGQAQSKRPPRILQRTDSPHVRLALEALDPPRLRGRTVEEAAVEVGSLGDGAIQGLFALLAGTLDGPEFASRLVDDPTRGDVPGEDAIILRALKRLSPSAVANHVAVQALGEASIDVRRVALRVFGEVCGADGVDAWIDVLAEIDPVHLRRAYLQGPCEESLGRMLARDDEGFARLAARGEHLSNDLFALAVAGVASAGRPRGVDVLLAWLGRDRDRDLELLRQIGILGEQSLGTIAEEHLTWVRPYLDDEDPRVRRETCVALGRLGDFRARRELIECLVDEDRATSRAAAWTLRRMTGRAVEGDERAWNEFFDAEIEWYEREGARLIAGLSESEPHAALAAARELVEHPLFKHEIAPEIAVLVDRGEPELAAGACASLGVLGSRVAVEPLLRALARTEDEVSDAAWLALRTLMGLQLPRDASVWRATLRGG